MSCIATPLRPNVSLRFRLKSCPVPSAFPVPILKSLHNPKCFVFALTESSLPFYIIFPELSPLQHRYLADNYKLSYPLTICQHGFVTVQEKGVLRDFVTRVPDSEIDKFSIPPDIIPNDLIMYIFFNRFIHPDVINFVFRSPDYFDYDRLLPFLNISRNEPFIERSISVPLSFRIAKPIKSALQRTVS